MKRSSGSDLFDVLEGVAAGFGAALVVTDGKTPAVSQLPSGRPVIFMPRCVSPVEAGLLLAKHLKSLAENIKVA